MKFMKSATGLIFIILIVGQLLARGQQQRGSLTAAAIFQQARSSIVVILGSATGQVDQGSGFIIGVNQIITNHHVVDGLERATVVFADGKRARVSRLLLDDPQEDFAVLEAPTGSRKPLVMGDELSLHEGDPVLAIGAPRGLELTISNGIVSSFRTIGTRLLIQNTATIAPGSSGGPLLDMRGKVVGITTLALRDSPGIYFSVGIGAPKRMLRGQSAAPEATAKATMGELTGGSASLEQTFDWIKQKLESTGNTTAPNDLIELHVGGTGVLWRAASRTALTGGWKYSTPATQASSSAIG